MFGVVTKHRPFLRWTFSPSIYHHCGLLQIVFGFVQSKAFCPLDYTWIPTREDWMKTFLPCEGLLKSRKRGEFCVLIYSGVTLIVIDVDLICYKARLNTAASRSWVDRPCGGSPGDVLRSRRPHFLDAQTLPDDVRIVVKPVLTKHTVGVLLVVQFRAKKVGFLVPGSWSIASSTTTLIRHVTAPKLPLLNGKCRPT